MAARDIAALHVSWDSAHLLPGLNFLLGEKSQLVPSATRVETYVMPSLVNTWLIMALIASCKEYATGRETSLGSSK